MVLLEFLHSRPSDDARSGPDDDQFDGLPPYPRTMLGQA